MPLCVEMLESRRCSCMWMWMLLGVAVDGVAKRGCSLQVTDSAVRLLLSSAGRHELWTRRGTGPSRLVKTERFASLWSKLSFS